MLTLIVFAFIAGCEAQDWKQLNNTNNYYLVHRPAMGLNYRGAEKYCTALGGSLASVHSQEENDFIYNLAKRGKFNGMNWEDMTLIGLKRTVKQVNEWIWSDTTKVSFRNWQIGEPNNYNHREDCTVMFTAIQHFYTKSKRHSNIYRGDWNDLECSRLFNSIVCKKEIKIESTTTLAYDKIMEFVYLAMRCIAFFIVSTVVHWILVELLILKKKKILCNATPMAAVLKQENHLKNEGN